MNVVVLIKGREAIPVRAIPLLANRRFMSVEDVVHLLGGTNARNVNLLGDLLSNHILDGNVEPIDKDWWVQSPLWELRALSEKKETDKSALRKLSLKELPAGAFVWKDEYQKLYEKRWNCDYQQMYFGLEQLNSEEEAQETEEDVNTHSEVVKQPKWTPQEWAEHISKKEYYWESIEVLERWREPNYSPFMLPELCAVVMEGFEQVSAAEDQAANSLISEINKLEIEIKYWETKDDSTASDALIVERQLARLRPKLAELLEKKRVLRGDYPEQKSKTVADISLQDDETGEIEAQNEHSKYRLQWRAVRWHETQVSESIEELRLIKATTITEAATRDEKLAARHVELAQIIKRKDMLVSIVDFNVNRAAETRYVIEEMTKSRPGAISIDETRRAAVIKDANEEIDALIASCTFTSETKQNRSTSGGEQVGNAGVGDKKPWMAIAPSDPEAMQPWYTPARYFARQLVIADSTMLVKRLILAEKVAISLSNVGIYKRGGKKQRHDAATILKAFANVTLG